MGYDIRRVPNREKSRYYILLTPRKKARQAIKTGIREAISHGGSLPEKELVGKINRVVAGWVAYFRVGHSSAALEEYLEMKMRSFLTRRKKRCTHHVGWQRWSNEYLYKTLGLYWDWKVQYLKGVEAYR